ncbi:MAG TPA: aminotransferase class V-fold PLP-dependent enzyme, partial [Pirellulales bacterium]|nr:aminotransferase class V-fold PLP-dependent enzyme [Pirellulales bacterium]
MSDINPDFISQLATRIYNEPPQHNGDAKTITSAADPRSSSVSHVPSHDVGSPHLAPPTAQVPTAAHPVPVRSLPGGFSHAGSGSEYTPPVGQAPRYEGLRNFVQKLRTSHVGPQHSLSSQGHEHTFLERLFDTNLAPKHGPRAFDVAAIRRDFPILHQQVHGRPLVWLDNAATTQKPQAVIDALSNYYARDNSNIHRGAHTLAARATDAYEHARATVQRFIGASSPQEIVFVRGTTEGINLVAQSWGRKFLQPGDEIVLSILEHHANIVPWQMIAKETGAVIRVIPVNDRGEIILEDYQNLLGPRTRFVSLTHASNSLGTVLPIGEMIQMAKRYNARVLIDGAQSVAHLPVDVQKL